jgi:predicted enzyme related to lactoylglutathione lyase
LEIVVNVDVDDLEKAVAFYSTGLGLRIGRRLFEGTVAEMLGATSKIYLLSKPPGSAAIPNAATPREYNRHWTPVHLDFIVDNVSETVERAVCAGAKLEQEIQTFTWGQVANMSDPFGHGFCLLQFLGSGYDEAA